MNTLTKILNEGAAKAALAREQGLCFVCLEPAKSKIHTPAGKREYQISGCCEECFDEMFKEEEF